MAGYAEAFASPWTGFRLLLKAAGKVPGFFFDFYNLYMKKII